MQTDELKSMHIAVYALSLAGGAHSKVHTEMVAQKCMELSPERFQWEHFPYPDKELVRKALFHASEKKHGRLVVGRSGMEQRGKTRDGWQLTPEGAAWVRENEHFMDGLPHTANSRNVVPKRDAERLLKRLRSETAFSSFLAEANLDSVTPYMFTDMLNCSPDAPRDTIRKKFERLLANAELIGDSSSISFLHACKSKFQALMTDSSQVINGNSKN